MSKIITYVRAGLLKGFDKLGVSRHTACLYIVCISAKTHFEAFTNNFQVFGHEFAFERLCILETLTLRHGPSEGFLPFRNAPVNVLLEVLLSVTPR